MEYAALISKHTLTLITKKLEVLKEQENSLNSVRFRSSAPCKSRLV